MKAATLVLGVIAASAGAAAIYLGVQLSDAQEQLAQETAARNADAVRIRQLEAERRRLEAALSTTGSPRPADAEPNEPPVPARNQRYADSMPPGGMPPGPAGGDRPGTAKNTPAEQNYRRLQQEVRLRRMYADMPAELGLDASLTDKLFNLLTEYQANEANDARAYQGDPFGRQAVEDAARAQRDAEIEALLGPDKAAEFQSFEATIPARRQVGRIGEGMAAANVPLSDAQRKSLIAVVAAEQESGPPPKRPTDGSTDSTYDARFLDWQADYSRRVQARVEPLLTAAQAAQYRAAVEAQNARRANARDPCRLSQ